MSGALGENEFVAAMRLSQCLDRIESLATHCGLPALSDADHTEWESLTQPFQIVALGETNAGKSTLLNALVGHPVCPTSPLPTTREIIHHQFANGHDAHPTALYDWESAHHPVESLRRLEVIDTPGLDSEARPSLLDALPTLASSDLLLVVFPVENTWTAATWQTLAKLTSEALDRTALIVQRADRKNREDLQVIDDHMRELCRKQIGRELPTFAVAAELAMAPPPHREPAHGDPVAIGFARLEKWIGQRLFQSARRHHQLELACQRASQRMREIEAALDARKRLLDDDNWFLAKLEKEVDERCQQTVANAPRALASERESYAREVVALTAFCRSQLAWTRSFVGIVFGHTTASRIEHKFSELLQQWITRLGSLEAERLLNGCRDHWQDVQTRVSERLQIEPDAAILDGEQAQATQQQFADTLVKSLPKITSQLRIRASLDKPIRQRHQRLKIMISLALIATTAAGICGTLGTQTLALQILMGAIILWLISMIYAWTNRKHLVNALGDRLWTSAETIETALLDDYHEAVNQLFSSYTNGLIDVRRQLAQRRAQLEPPTTQLDQLFLELKMIEHEATG